MDVCFQLFSGDGLPAKVCRQCVRLVNMSYKFKQQCESSDTTLRQYLRSQPYTVSAYIIVMSQLNIGLIILPHYKPDLHY
jgi:hypothetical protein